MATRVDEPNVDGFDNEAVESIDSLELIDSGSETLEFVPLLNHDDYEILTVHPFTIRRKDNHYEVKESDRGNRYVGVHLNRKTYYKHRLIAEQFLPNPNNYNEIDHINHDKSDNRIENLRWCSSSTNNRNRTVYNGIQVRYVDNIPDDSIAVDYYETRTERYEFEGYYYHKDKFYYDNDMNYRVLNINIAKCGSQFVMMRDTNNHSVAVTINRFKQQHDLI